MNLITGFYNSHKKKTTDVKLHLTPSLVFYCDKFGGYWEVSLGIEFMTLTALADVQQMSDSAFTAAVELT